MRTQLTAARDVPANATQRAETSPEPIGIDEVFNSIGYLEAQFLPEPPRTAPAPRVDRKTFGYD